MDWIQQWQSKLNKQNGVAPLVRTGGSRHTGLAALPYRNIQTVVFSREQEQVAVVHQPSDKGGCHLLIVQYVDPSGEFQICIQDDDFLLMDLGKVVKQQLGSCPVIGEYYGSNVPLFRRNGYRQSGVMIP